MQPSTIRYGRNGDNDDAIAHYSKVKALQARQKEQSTGWSQQNSRPRPSQQMSRKNGGSTKPPAVDKSSSKPKKPSRIPWAQMGVAEPSQPVIRSSKPTTKQVTGVPSTKPTSQQVIGNFKPTTKQPAEVPSNSSPVKPARNWVRSEPITRAKDRALGINTDEARLDMFRIRCDAPVAAEPSPEAHIQTRRDQQSTPHEIESVAPHKKLLRAKQNKKGSPRKSSGAVNAANTANRARNVDLAKGISALIAAMPSRPKDPSPVCKQTSPFFSLPGEIRNQIYGYLYEITLVTISGNTSHQHGIDGPRKRAAQACGLFPRAAKVLRITADAPRPKAGGRKAAKGLQYIKVPGCQPDAIEGIEWKSSVSALLLGCKALGVEASSVLYSKTAFFFDDAKRLNGFLDTVTPANLAMIPRIYVHIRAYGIPEATKDNVWEQKHIKCWMSTFSKMAASMHGVRYIHISLDVGSMTDHLLRAFRPLASGQDWKERAGHMFMLQPLSSMKLDSLVLKIKAGDREWVRQPANFEEQFKFHWNIVNMQPFPALQDKVFRRNFQHMNNMHRTLTEAMVDMGRSGTADQAFAGVAVEVSDYLSWSADPILNCLREG